MTDYFSMVGIEQFSDKVANKVIERGADRIAECVVEKIKPLITQCAGTSPKPDDDIFYTRKEAAKIFKVSEPTLRRMHKQGHLKVYGEGTRHMRFKRSEVITALDNL